MIEEAPHHIAAGRRDIHALSPPTIRVIKGEF